MSISGRNKIIAVLGMHRSGTSAITRGLQVMGVDLGENLMSPNLAVNAKGFWEDMDLNALNIEMMEALGRDWHYMSPIDQRDLEMLRGKGFDIRAAELLRNKISENTIFGVKDPRITKLMPFWNWIFQSNMLDTYYVISLRNPMSVAKSLEKRDGIETSKSYLLWLDHMLSAVEESEGAKRILVDYDLLMTDPERELRRMSAVLNLPLNEVELEIYRSEFLDDGLRHAAYSLADLQQNPDMPALVREAFELMHEVAQGRRDIEDPDFMGQIKSLRLRLRELRDLLKLTDTYWAKADLLSKELAQCDQSMPGLNTQIADQQNQIADQQNQIAGLTEQIHKMQLEFDSVIASSSWKITKPVREMGRWLHNPRAQLKRYLIGIGKLCYRLLPINEETRGRHYRKLSERYPHLFPRVSMQQLHPAGLMKHFQVECRPEIDPDAYQGSIEIGTSTEPVVSVIIPIYGKCSYTLRCLASIADNPPSTPFEVIVVDDCSPDNSAEVLQRVGGIRLVINNQNLGFVRSCNAGAGEAKGQYVYFLNNDTEVLPGWMDELVNTFDLFPGTGFAGSRLIYPDGTLQEAGGIIWQDGSAWNFGRNQDPWAPTFNYAREVDYCSGASIIMPKVLFDELGGFDERYVPAYCEDADLALQIRDKGYRVIYQPMSTVVHYEGVTSGTDVTQGVKAYQVENTKKLFQRWQGLLEHYQPNGMNVDDAKDRCAKRRVLVVDHCTPTPNQDAGSLIIYNMMLLLREMDFQVTFIPEDNFLYMPEYTPALQRAGIEVLYAPYVSSVSQHLKEFGGRYSLTILTRPVVAERHFETVRQLCPKAKIIFYTVDLHFLRMAREAAIKADESAQKSADKMKQLEMRIMKSADATILHSTTELELLRPDLPQAKLHVFPLVMDVRGSSRPFSERNNIVFVGGYQHAPNVDAVKFFITEVMPLLRERLPGVCFYAVGSRPPAEIQELAQDDVIITGFVEDLDGLLEKMRVSVAPLRYGAGIKGKIGSSMAVGLPVVATLMASEGMSLVNGENILIADSAEEIAEAVARLYNDEVLWGRISEAGVKFADAMWGAEATWKILASILADVGIEATRNERRLKLYVAKK